MFWVLVLVSCENSSDTGNIHTNFDYECPLTWNNWGEGFFTTWCQSCHSRTTPQRNGAPEGMNFDTLTDVFEWQAAIRDSVIDNDRMPKGGGIPNDVKEQLIEYMDCLQ